MVLPCAAGPDPSGRRAMASAAPSAARLRIRVEFMDSLLERYESRVCAPPIYIAAPGGRSSCSGTADDLQETSRGPGRIRRRADGRDHRNSVRACLYDLRRVVMRDAADPHEWNADVRSEFPDECGTNELEVWLGRRREHGAHGDVVSAVKGCRLGLLDTMSRDAKAHAGAE